MSNFLIQEHFPETDVNCSMIQAQLKKIMNLFLLKTSWRGFPFSFLTLLHTSHHPMQDEVHRIQVIAWHTRKGLGETFRSGMQVFDILRKDGPGP
jgi:hypothetical protein